MIFLSEQAWKCTVRTARIKLNKIPRHSVWPADTLLSEALYKHGFFFLIVKATSTTLRQTVLHNDPVASQDHYARFRIRTRDLCFCRLVGLIGVISMCHSLFVENIRTADVKTAYLYTLLRKRTYSTSYVAYLFPKTAYLCTLLRKRPQDRFPKQKISCFFVRTAKYSKQDVGESTVKKYSQGRQCH